MGASVFGLPALFKICKVIKLLNNMRMKERCCSFSHLNRMETKREKELNRALRIKQRVDKAFKCQDGMK